MNGFDPMMKDLAFLLLGGSLPDAAEPYRDVRVNTIDGPRLNVTSGNLVCVDPYWEDENWIGSFPEFAFGPIPIGFHATKIAMLVPTALAIAEGARGDIVLAFFVIIDEDPIVQWVPALGSVDEPLGFGVDFGQGAIFDLTNQDVFRDEQMGKWLNEVSDSGRPLSELRREPEGADVIVFSCGPGDGRYVTYLGHSGSGSVSQVCVDMNFLQSFTY